MKTANFLTSSCRYCRFYKTEGRRGGMCQQLGVPVQAHWKACVLAAHPFNSTWNEFEKVVSLENSFSLKDSGECSSVTMANAEMLVESRQPTAV